MDHIQPLDAADCYDVIPRPVFCFENAVQPAQRAIQDRMARR